MKNISAAIFGLTVASMVPLYASDSTNNWSKLVIALIGEVNAQEQKKQRRYHAWHLLTEKPTIFNLSCINQAGIPAAWIRRFIQYDSSTVNCSIEVYDTILGKNVILKHKIDLEGWSKEGKPIFTTNNCPTCTTAGFVSIPQRLLHTLTNIFQPSLQEDANTTGNTLSEKLG
jgi:hypothetical protein